MLLFNIFFVFDFNNVNILSYVFIERQPILFNSLHDLSTPGCGILWVGKCNHHGYVPLVVNTSRSFLHSWLITGFVTILTQQVPLMEQKLLTLSNHLSSPAVLSGFRVTRSSVICICFVDRCVSFCTLFSFCDCVVCPSSVYGFWLYLRKPVQHYKTYSRTSLPVLKI
jgi:hypothetical protein